jgi:hypothetical protein
LRGDRQGIVEGKSERTEEMNEVEEQKEEIELLLYEGTQ